MSALECFASALHDVGDCSASGLRDAGQLSLSRRMAVHRNNRVLGLIGALEDSFPVTSQLLGTDCFRAIARDFIHVSPPQSPALFEYGNALPAFLAGLEELVDYPYLADVARLEYQRVQAWHGADASPLTAADFARWLARPELLPGLRFSLLPSASLVRSHWAVGSIWLSHQGELPMQGVDVSNPESVLVLRPDDRVVLHVISEPAGALVERLLAGECLAEAIAGATQTTPTFDLRECFASLIACRCVAAITPTMELST